MKKTLVYLDQSYLSSMAKEAAGATRARHSAMGQAMGAVLKLLRTGVEHNKILCPSSLVHEQESGLDNRVGELVHRISQELSDGISFHTYRDIELGQTLRAMYRHLGQEAKPEDGRWQHALMHNPHRSIRHPRVYVHIPSHPVFAEDDRDRKSRMQDFRTKQYDRRHQVQRGSFNESRRQEMMGLVRQVYVEPYVQFLAKMVAAYSGQNPFPTANETSSPQEILDYLEAVIPPLAARLFEQYLRITGVTDPIPDERYWRFFLSPEFDAIPYYDIFCSLVAGFLFYKPERKPRPSDPYDIAALSSVLPYVDIVTTDSAMKDMLVQLGLERKYGVEVYSSRLSDIKAFTDRLASLV